ncbi:MAG TPA: TrkA C-terminal domain-containing protein, partial [Actinomycetota bacterium]|nr:TrkA C-terminal domain-containing protein [Actinomycetota bacterium]
SVVEEGSPGVGRTLKELSFETETGMLVLAVERGRRWIYRPRARFQLEAGDRVISIGPEDGIAEIDRLVRSPAEASAG